MKTLKMVNIYISLCTIHILYTVSYFSFFVSPKPNIKYIIIIYIEI